MCAVSIRGKTHRNWLPGVEVRGEGIFLAFDQKTAEAGEDNPLVVETPETLNGRYQRMALDRGFCPDLSLEVRFPAYFSSSSHKAIGI